MSCKHYECLCYSPATESCDYYLIFGRRRGIPGDKCHLCLQKFDEEHKPINREYQPRRIMHDLIRRVEKVYDPRKSIAVMQAESGIGSSFIIGWVRKVHPEFKNWGNIKV